MGLDNPIHIAFLLILLLLVFGAKRLPEMGRSLGDGMRGFKDALSGHAGVSASDSTPQSSVPHALAAPSQPATPAPGVGAMQPATPAPGVAAMQPATPAPGVAAMQPTSPVAGVQTTAPRPVAERPPAA